MVFFRSHLLGHHIVPKGDEFFGREETGLKIFVIEAIRYTK
jgi:hypothetical protein